MIYTTGSTGFPKPALLSHRNITCQNMCLAGGFDMFDNPRMLVNLPPSHVGCQAEQLMTPLFAGGTAVVLPMFDAEQTLDAIQKYRVTCFGQVPALFALEWRLPNYGDFDLSSLRFALFGGQQVTRQFLEQVSRMAPKFGTGLGLTEMAGFVTYSPLDGTVDDVLTGVGYDMPVTPLSIRRPMNPDGTAGQELPDGEPGEICFSGPQVFIAYVNNDEAYRKTVSTDGFCYTGDLGYKTPQGLMFSGRSKLVLKPKGYQVHPAQIEQHFALLVEHVACCGAVGAPHDVFTEGVVLFVEAKPGGQLTREMLERARTRYCRLHAAAALRASRTGRTAAQSHCQDRLRAAQGAGRRRGCETAGPRRMGRRSGKIGRLISKAPERMYPVAEIADLGVNPGSPLTLPSATLSPLRGARGMINASRTT